MAYLRNFSHFPNGIFKSLLKIFEQSVILFRPVSPDKHKANDRRLKLVNRLQATYNFVLSALFRFAE